jgi:hypothetical protein
VSRSGWFRRQQSLLATDGTSVAKRIWQGTRALSVPAPLKARGTALTASSAALVLGAGVAIVAFASPGSHAAAVSYTSTTGRSDVARGSQVADPLQVVSATPASGAKKVNGASPLSVVFSSPLAATSPMPTLSPNIAGNWTVQGDAAVFTPTVGWFQNTKVTVTIPAGLAGVISVAGYTDGNGGTLNAPQSVSFTTASFSTLRLQQLLAQLGYLPMTWTSKSATAISPANAHAELAAAYSAPAGTFHWQGSYPWNLTSQWKAGSYNILQDGAVRAFESLQNLTMDGLAGRSVWSDLLTAVAKDKKNPNGYSSALASQHNGHVVLRTPVNTGISDAATQDGTFPVYLKFTFTYMKGLNPDGTPYDDPVWYASYFNGGDAVHEFPRGSYGFNQSLGCVELPWDAAVKVYPYLTYGSLVTVTGPVGA